MKRRRARAHGGSVAARLVLIAFVPTVAMVHFGWSDVEREQGAVASAGDLLELVELERRVAAVSAPAFIEYLAHRGLATIDQLGVARDIAIELTDIDYLTVYTDNVAELDAVLAPLLATDAERNLSDGGRFGPELDRLIDELEGIRADTNDLIGDPIRIDAWFEQLDGLLHDVLTTHRRLYDSNPIASGLTRYRSESAALTWVLQTAGDAARAMLNSAVNVGLHQIPIARAESAHEQAVLEFSDLLADAPHADLAIVTQTQPDALAITPVEVHSIDVFDIERARSASVLVMEEVTYLRSLDEWAGAYYGAVSTEVAASGAATRRDLDRTVTVMYVVTLLAMLLVMGTARSILRPLLRLGRRAAEIGLGEIELEPLPVRGPAVLRSLTQTVNTMHDTLRQIDRQAAALAAGRLDHESLAESSPGRLGASIRRSVERLTAVTAQLQVSEERSSAIVSYATIAIWTIDDGGRVVSANAAAERIVGLPAHEQIGLPLGTWVRRTSGECEVVRADSSRVWIDVDHTVVNTSGGRLRTVLAEDLTERREFERRLAKQARRDALTGLPNRFAVLERLAVLSEGGKTATVLFLDVDGFKSVNDTRGHAVGDVVLAEIASRLQRGLRDGSMVGRLGGDEFVVVATDLPDELAAVTLGRRLIERVEQPYQLGDDLFGLSASVGVATMLPGDVALEVIHRADAAVYQAKELGRARVEVFDQEFQARVEQRAETELAIREAIIGGEIEMYLQPIFDLADERPIGAEALARWNRPGVGYVSPAEFIAIAENSTLIIDLTRNMLYAACERLAAWKQADPNCTLRLSVNLSGRHLVDGDLIGDLVEVLSVTGADPKLLELELTETQLLADLEHGREVLETARAMGITIAVDDFGTGFSSMAYLRQLSVDVIKVDRSFVSGAGLDGFDSTAIEAMVNFGRVLGVHVVAEGIETEAQLAFVRARGCTRGQGYLLGRPMPVAETEAVLFGRSAQEREHLDERPTVVADAVPQSS